MSRPLNLKDYEEMQGKYRKEKRCNTRTEGVLSCPDLNCKNRTSCKLVIVPCPPKGCGCKLIIDQWRITSYVNELRIGRPLPSRISSRQKWEQKLRTPPPRHDSQPRSPTTTTTTHIERTHDTSRAYLAPSPPLLRPLCSCLAAAARRRWRRRGPARQSTPPTRILRSRPACGLGGLLHALTKLSGCMLLWVWHTVRVVYEKARGVHSLREPSRVPSGQRNAAGNGRQHTS
jgi:hypothetical protein